jgi:hypothetical protein
MGNAQQQHTTQINFEDMQTILEKPDLYLTINTLAPNEQQCLLPNTISILEEELAINQYLKTDKSIRIVVYGRNCNDDTAQAKCQQLSSLGFSHIFWYVGGLFEWMLLQDIYGKDLFPTTKHELDILKYKPNSRLTIGLLKN